MSKRVVTFNEDQFQALYQFVTEKVESLIERSIDYQDSEILNDYEDLLDAYSVLEEADKWVTLTEED